MKKLIIPAIAALAFASPAMAGEARVEVRGGAVWIDGLTEDTWGAAAGYDFDLGQAAFAGVEVSGDKMGVTGTIVSWGLNGRLGLKAGEKTRVFAAGGYQTKICNGCAGQWGLGAGVEQTVVQRVYVKAEYRHLFERDFADGADVLVAGVGIRF